MTIIFMVTLATPGTSTSRHDASKKKACGRGLSEKRIRLVPAKAGNAFPMGNSNEKVKRFLKRAPDAIHLYLMIGRSGNILRPKTA